MRVRGFGDLVAAEWIKTRSLRSSWWVPAGTAVFVVGCAAAATLADDGAVGAADFRPFDAFPASGYWTLMLVAVGMGALGVVGEYSSGLICTTTVAVPARGSVVLAKAAVTAGQWTVVGAAATTGSFAVSQWLSGRQVGASIGEPGVGRALAASVLLAPVCALVGLGLGVLLRHGAATVGAGVFALLMLPTMLSESDRRTADVKHALVATAWRRLVETWEPDPHSLAHPAGVAGSWAVYLLWPLTAVALAVYTVRRRDV